MKQLFVVFLIMSSLKAFAIGELAKKHLSVCEENIISKEIAAGDQCSILIVPKKAVDMNGLCTGKLLGYECEVRYRSIEGQAVLRLSCMYDGESFLDESFLSSSTAYDVVAVISRMDKTQTLIKSQYDYLNLGDDLLEVNLLYNDNEVLPVIRFGPGEKPTLMTDISCM